ncbi:uncharacterized protein LOC129602784 [Paramacrobiotus metropolitanus]|uniref:uncharacterized protein LOC129602784 n=1 Tax=Paramacrobiotus metropolitanus TaxID=2943436 RepID=UPI0024464711|nr:uncharacterized protein LOC129602784 [Paramacrobiotus metropolitanus]
MLPLMEEPVFPKLYVNHSLLYREADLINALLRSLKIAQNEYRIRVGFNNAMKILELDPSSVVMCILPVGTDKKDPLSHLQVMLIEAYCTENGIRLLKVVSSDELSHIVKPLPETDDEADDMEDDFMDDDCSSLIVIQNSHHMHNADYELQKIYDCASLHCSARPIIHLPS